jgi:hypothetical protein
MIEKPSVLLAVESEVRVQRCNNAVYKDHFAFSAAGACRKEMKNDSQFLFFYEQDALSCVCNKILSCVLSLSFSYLRGTSLSTVRHM